MTFCVRAAPTTDERILKVAEYLLALAGQLRVNPDAGRHLVSGLSAVKAARETVEGRAKRNPDLDPLAQALGELEWGIVFCAAAATSTPPLRLSNPKMAGERLKLLAQSMPARLLAELAESKFAIPLRDFLHAASAHSLAGFR